MSQSVPRGDQTILFPTGRNCDVAGYVMNPQCCAGNNLFRSMLSFQCSRPLPRGMLICDAFAMPWQ